MDLSKASYDDESGELDLEESDGGDEEMGEEDALISLAIKSDDPVRIDAFRDAVHACMKSYSQEE